MTTYTYLKFKNPTHQFHRLSLNISKIPQPKNKTILLINNYYDDLISFKHLKPLQYIALFAISVLSIYVINIIFSNPNKTDEYIMMFLVATIGLLVVYLKESFRYGIIKDYNQKYHTNFSYFWQIQDDWLYRNFGKDYDVNQLFKAFDEWKIKRDKFPSHKPFSFARYTYQSDAKPRINALIIALFSLSAVILINISKPIDFEVFFVYMIHNFFIIAIFLIFIIIFFYHFIFLTKFILEMTSYVLDILTSKNRFSEEKYKKFMGLLAQKLEADTNKH